MQIRVNGRLRKFTLGRYPATGAAEARRRGAQLLARIWAGESPAPLRKARSPLFRDFAVRYRKQRKGRWKPSSLETYDIYMRNRLVPHFGRLRLDAIDHACVSAWFDAASADKPGAANRAYEILRAMLKTARQWGDLDDSVPDACAHIVTNPSKSVARYLNREELNRLGRRARPPRGIRSLAGRGHPPPNPHRRATLRSGQSQVGGNRADVRGGVNRTASGFQDRAAHDLAGTRRYALDRAAAPQHPRGTRISETPDIGSRLPLLVPEYASKPNCPAFASTIADTPGLRKASSTASVCPRSDGFSGIADGARPRSMRTWTMPRCRTLRRRLPLSLRKGWGSRGSRARTIHRVRNTLNRNPAR